MGLDTLHDLADCETLRNTDDVIPILLPGECIRDLSYCVYKCQQLVRFTKATI